MQKEYIHVLKAKARGNKISSFHKKVRMSAKDAFLLTEKELKRLNSSVRNKKLTDKHFGDTIFKTIRRELNDNERDGFVYNHFTAAYYTFIDFKERMIEEKCFDYRGIKKYGYLIDLLLYDIIYYADFIGQKIDKDYFFYRGIRDYIEDSKWHYVGTNHLLYNSIYDKKMLDDKFAFILSAVSLRQSLELKMQRILGIEYIRDLKGEKIYTKHHFFFNFILKNKEHFDLSSINIKIIQKIFEFCNLSVHIGVMPYVWQMNYAMKFCDPLFFDENKKNKGFHFHSSVKISNYNELKEKLENKLLIKFPNPEYELKIQWLKPEAQILK